MKRKQYEAPAAEVVELKIAGMLMTSGETTATDYIWHTESEEARPFDDLEEEINVTNE